MIYDSASSHANHVVNALIDTVFRAAERLDGSAHRTPVLTSRTADERSGARLFFKCENFQRTGSFKFRGAYNAIANLSPAQRRAGVIAYSSGNHAQALALAGRLQGVSVTLIMPRDAPAIKVAATRGYGGDIVFYDRFRESREVVGQRLLAERGSTGRQPVLIPPYDHPDVIAGQGTCAKELFEEVGPLDVLLVCLGGGGLLAGSALAAQALAPACRVIGVEPEAGNDGQQSLRRGEIVRIEVPRTLADGAMTTHLGEHNFPIIRERVEAIVTVPDEALVATLRFFVERLKLVVEPTGCLAAAAAFTGAWPCAGQRVGVLISGGNVDPAALGRFLTDDQAGGSSAG